MYRTPYGCLEPHDLNHQNDIRSLVFTFRDYLDRILIEVCVVCVLYMVTSGMYVRECEDILLIELSVDDYS